MRQIVSVLILMWLLFSAGLVFAEDQVQSNPPSPPSAEQAAQPAQSAPAAEALKPDPSGTNTGGASDVVGASANAPTADDMKRLSANEPLAVKLADVAGHNRTVLNFVWTLICCFLVFFMQAGFAMVETGFTRAKNAGHTMAMNMMVFVFAALGYWAIGYGLAWIMKTNLAGELMRVRLVVEHFSYVLASAIVLGAAVLSALVVRRRIGRLDLVAVLKTRD